jgi:hypothetical protein
VRVVAEQQQPVAGESGANGGERLEDVPLLRARVLQVAADDGEVRRRVKLRITGPGFEQPGEALDAVQAAYGEDQRQPVALGREPGDDGGEPPCDRPVPAATARPASSTAGTAMPSGTVRTSR